MAEKSSLKSFSKLTRKEKIQVLFDYHLLNSLDKNTLKEFWFKKNKAQYNLTTISENVVSHYFLPFSIAPNFLINNQLYYIPMVTEESSVVAAASSAAKFWLSEGGFQTRVLSTTKIGQIHFNWYGSYALLQQHITTLKAALTNSAQRFLTNMNKRGGGLKDIEFLDFTDQLPHYYQVKISFDTADAMGANIINTCLESMALALKEYFSLNFTHHEKECDILMAILSNYTPECLVECKLECDIQALHSLAGHYSANQFAQRFKQAVDIASFDIYRAATHNKGIFNGIDAVLMATGNDLRAAAASGHAYAAKEGSYKGLTQIKIDLNRFVYTLQLPLAIGTVGGLTSLHPMVNIALKLLKNPSAKDLMQIAAAVGMANNFAAIRALITSGIQYGHMKFHLHNIINSLSTNELEKEKVLDYFENKIVSYTDVEAYLFNLRNE